MARPRVNSLYRQFPKDSTLYVFFCHDLSINVSAFATSHVHAEVKVRDFIYEEYGLKSCFLSHVVTVEKNHIV